MAKDASDSKVLVELGAVLYDYEAMTDIDHQHFEVSTAGRIFSMVGAQKPLIRPDGVLTGLEVIPAVSGGNDQVDVSKGTAWINGALVTLAADETDVSITRATDPKTHRINSITLTNAEAIAAVAGTEHTEFSETRAADGGPPLIATTSIELAQVRTASFTAAPITADEIFAVPNQHRELASYPVVTVHPLGKDGIGTKGTAQVEFSEALPLIHTGSVAKTVYAKYYNPNFAQIPEASEFRPPRDSATQSEDSTYDGPRAATKWGRGTGSFNCLHDGKGSSIIMQVKGTTRALKFYPDKYLTGFWLMQGSLAIADEYPVGANMRATINLGADMEPIWVE